MSWDTFVYDKFLPIATSKLSSENIQIGKSYEKRNSVSGNSEHSCHSPSCPNISLDNICSSDTAFVKRVVDQGYPKYTTHDCEPDCDQGGFTVPCQYCTTEWSSTDTCAIPNGKSTCTLGSQGDGDISDYTKNVGWDIATGTIGWAMCRYAFDFTGYNELDILNGPGKLINWLTGVCKGVNTSAPNGIVNSGDKNRIRDSNVIFGILSDFYDQIYFQGIYSDRKTPPKFAVVDILSDMQNFTNDYVIRNVQRFGTLYDGPVSDSLKTSLENILQAPRPFFSTTYKISMNMSYQQFMRYKKSSDPDAFATVLLSNFLRDYQGKIINTSSGSDYGTKDPVLKNSKVVGLTAIELDVSSPYHIGQGIQESDFVVPDKYPGYFFCTAQIEAEISVWSPMTFIYFRSYAVDIDDNVAMEITRSGINGQPFPMPIQNFLRICSKGTEDCKNLIINLCGLSYEPPGNIKNVVSDDYFMTNSPNCMCYMSLLTPVGSQPVGNQTAMCFDENCDQSMKDMFNLSRSNCAGRCGEMSRWINEKGQNQPRNLAYYDDNSFRDICGDNFTPYSDKKLSIKVLIVGIVCSIIVSATVYLGCSSQSISISASFLIAVVALVISGSITAFLSIDYAGVGKCEGDGFVCRSKITKREISDTFCNFSMNCECDIVSSCPGNCFCQSTTCISRSTKQRPTVDEKQSYTDGPLAIGFLVGSIFLAFSVLFASKAYKWGFRDSYVYAISGIFVVVGILLVVLVARKTVTVTRFSSSCA